MPINKSLRVLKMVFSILRDVSRSDSIAVFNTKQTLEKIEKEHISVSRFGDGEFNLVLGKDMPFQYADSELVSHLKRVLYDQDANANCLISIPYSYHSVAHLKFRSKIFWIKYFAEFRRDISPFLNKKYHYGDSQISRIYINRQNKADSLKYFEIWKRIFRGKRILIVEGSKSKFGVRNDLLQQASNISRVICPSEQTFAVYDELLRYLSSLSEFDLILLALGPTASILAYDLSKVTSIQVIDSGNMDLEYEWMKMGVVKPVALGYKYTIEADKGTEMQEFLDDLYEKQIIKRIGI